MPNTLNTEGTGVFQGDVILRTAVVMALEDLRAHPWLLDYAFASLGFDDLTSGEYGQREVARAKEWFQKTQVRVVHQISPTNPPPLPIISIQMLSSQELPGEGTLSDTHYQPFEDNDWDWPTLVGPVTPTSYAAATGTFTLDPKSVPVVLAPGMVVVSASGREYPIVGVNDAAVFAIAPGAVDDFRGMVVKTANPAYLTELESAVFREGYALGAHVDSEPVHLTYLHSILVFILRRYCQSLLEARGFERSVLNSTDFQRDGEELPEFVYTRYCQISGNVRHVWPKTIAMKVTSAVAQLQESAVGTDPTLTPKDDLQKLLDSDPLDLIGG